MPPVLIAPPVYRLPYPGAVPRRLDDVGGEMIDVKEFGAGSLDPAKDTAAFRAAAATGRRLYVPYGTYRLNVDQVVLTTPGTGIVGEGRDRSTIELIGSAPGTAISAVGPNVDAILKGMEFRDFTLVDAGAPHGVNRRGLALVNCTLFHVENVLCQHYDVGFDIVNSLIGTMWRAEAQNCRTGERLRGTNDLAVGAANNLIHHEGCRYHANLGRAVDSSSGTDASMLIFDGCQFEGNGSDGSPTCEFLGVGRPGVPPAVLFRGGWFEQNQGDSNIRYFGHSIYTGLVVYGIGFYCTDVQRHMEVNDGVVDIAMCGFADPVDRVAVFGANTSGRFAPASISDWSRVTSEGAVQLVQPDGRVRRGLGLRNHAPLDWEMDGGRLMQFAPATIGDELRMSYQDSGGMAPFFNGGVGVGYATAPTAGLNTLFLDASDPALYPLKFKGPLGVVKTLIPNTRT